MYKGPPHLADYCTRCSTSAAMAVWLTSTLLIIYACILLCYIIILLQSMSLESAEILIRLTSSASTMLLPPL